jgi:hypothetical protein
MERAVSDDKVPPAVAALRDAVQVIRAGLRPAQERLSVSTLYNEPQQRERAVEARQAIEMVLVYVDTVIEPASHARQFEPDPDLVRIRHLAAIGTRLEVASEALEAAKDIDEDALRALARFDDLTRAYETIHRVMMDVRLALTKANATPYG